MLYFLLYKIGQWLVLSLPLKAAYHLALILADIRYLLFTKNRRIVKKNLGVVLGKVNNKRLNYEARWVFRNFAKYLVDFFRFSKLDKNFFDKFVSIEGRNYLDAALDEGRGVILVTAHLGNWELGGAVVASMDYPLNVIALSHANKKVDDFFINQRASKGVKVVSLGPGIRTCFRALSKNEIVAVLGDRDFSGQGLKIEFFGKKALIPKGAAMFSIRSGAPIVPIFVVRQKDDKFKVIFEPRLSCQLTDNAELDTESITKEVAKVLEGYIKRYPSQWSMATDFWGG